MKKKSKFKSWLIKTLRRWLNKLAPEENVLKIERTAVPLITIESNVSFSKRDGISQDDIDHILARRLGEQIIEYADVQWYEKMDMSVFDEQIIYRARVRVAADKRG